MSSAAGERRYIRRPMRFSPRWSLVLVGAASALVFSPLACTDAATSSPGASGDAGADAADPRRDAGSSSTDPDDDASTTDEDASLPAQQEKEPNDGKTTTEIDSMTIPGAMSGTLDPAKDVDIFAVAPKAGELWEWTLAPSGADLVPHLTVFDTAQDNLNPTVLATSGAGTSVMLEHFVLSNGSFVAAVRDARNVSGGGNAGGPTFGYTLTATKKTPSPTTVTVPSTKSGKLASLSSVDLYTFTLTTETELDVIIRADRKAAPSTLDSRLSLFDANAKKSIGTNDDATGSTTDSQLGGTLPAGPYIAVVENEGTNGADLSYEIEFALR